MTCAYVYGLTHRPKMLQQDTPRYQPDLSAEYHPCACVSGRHLVWQRDDFWGFVAHLREVWS